MSIPSARHCYLFPNSIGESSARHRHLDCDGFHPEEREEWRQCQGSRNGMGRSRGSGIVDAVVDLDGTLGPGGSVQCSWLDRLPQSAVDNGGSARL